MNKKSKIYILALVWVAALIQLCINEGIDREEKIVEALSIYESNPYEAKISAYGYYGDGFISEDVKSSMVKKLASDLGVTTDYNIDYTYNDDCSLTTFSKKGKYADTTIKILSMDTINSDKEAIIEQYIMFNIVLYEGVETSYSYKEQIEELYSQLGIEPSINIYVSSIVEGKMDDVTMENVKEDFLTLMRAEEIDSGKFDDVYTIYGYTRDIDEYVYQKGKKVNVNMAFSYDEDTNQTVLHMAIPFVDKSY